MKFVQFIPDDGAEPVAGVLSDDQITDLSGQTDVGGDSFAAVLEYATAEGVGAFASADGQTYDLDAVSLCAPVPDDGRVICLGGVYTQHLRERDDDFNRVPSQWIAPPPAVIGDGDAIRLHERVRDRVVPAVELGVVIGCAARNVDEADAFDHVAGYTVCNDVTARTDWPGPMAYKLMETFCPTGPGITPRSEISNPANLQMEIAIDDEPVCTGTTASMRFTISFLVSYLSSIFELQPGDVISMGDPGGVTGTLTPGSIVETTIEGVGQLVNSVEAK